MRSMTYRGLYLGATTCGNRPLELDMRMPFLYAMLIVESAAKWRIMVTGRIIVVISTHGDSSVATLTQNGSFSEIVGVRNSRWHSTLVTVFPWPGHHDFQVTLVLESLMYLLQPANGCQKPTNSE